MIATDKRNAIYLLHQEGMPDKEIARRLGVSPTSVRTIVQQKGVLPRTVRKDKQHIDPQLLRRLYQECAGRVQRMHEKLQEEQGVQVKYSTLTRMVRELGLGTPPQVRCQQVPDEPGLEMQHDTTVYRLVLGGPLVRLVASLIYLRYSKRRYLKFYRVFGRFQMKCFLHQALTFWGYVARHCIIDNTNLARLRGTGRDAVMVPEMAAFAQQRGFEFICHEKGHANRKAGEERSFWTVETNFLPGRTFRNLEDLNQQALEWSTVRLEQRPQTKAGIIPAKAFEHERTFLTPLPPHLPAPYKFYDREVDQYGYTAVEAISTYLDWVLERKGPARHRFLRSLLALSRKMSPELFIPCVERAAKYRIQDITTIERIALLGLQQGAAVLPLVAVDQQFTQREAYLEGSLTDAPDLSIYQDSPDPPTP